MILLGKNQGEIATTNMALTHHLMNMVEQVVQTMTTFSELSLSKLKKVQLF